jgi:hypothetical protein
MKPMDWLLRSVLAMNVVLLGLTFLPAFSGSGATPGLADRLWGDIRYGGYRADVVWMCGTTLLLIVAGVVLRTRQPGARRTTSLLCLYWLPCFAVYLGYTVTHMFG